jgi:hypothetical protein
MITRTEKFAFTDLLAGIREFEDKGWGVRQIIQIAWNNTFVVFERNAE